MQFVADVRHVHPTYDFAVGIGFGIDVYHPERVRLVTAIRVQGCYVSQFLGGRLSGELRRRIESRISLE
jgi:hypothetical protein